MSDGAFFFGGLVLLFILWVYTGGPSHPISHQGIFITPITGVGQTQVGYGPQIQLKGIFSAGASTVSNGNGTGNVTPANNSPYSSLVTIGRATGESTVPDGYLEIFVSSKAGESIDITGWKITSNATGASAIIPTAVLLMHIGQHNTLQDVLLRPGDVADISPDASPVATSFEGNKCLPYLNTNKSLYNPCISGHARDAGFLTGQWYIYLNKPSLWKTSSDLITLYDSSEKTVGSFSY
jgi:hypothetical protein